MPANLHHIVSLSSEKDACLGYLCIQGLILHFIKVLLGMHCVCDDVFGCPVACLPSVCAVMASLY